MYTNIHFSKATQPLVAIAGHIGVGHSYSANGIVQEDSHGFAVLSYLLAQALDIDITITKASFNHNNTEVTIHTKNGAAGVACLDEGFTPWEVEFICKNIAGVKSYAPQSLAQQLFGRITGHGVHKSACVLCEAVSKAILNSFKDNCSEHFLYAKDDQQNSTGCFLGAIMDFGTIPVACLLTINASVNGTGPNEDTEGNIGLGNKYDIMQQLNMLDIPTIILESKQYTSAVGDKLDKTHFCVRWDQEHDNPVVAECLAEAAKELNYPVLTFDHAYPRHQNQLEKFGNLLADKLTILAQDFGKAQKSSEKIIIAEQIATIAAKDLGGAIFMSNTINNIVGNGGLYPGTAAVLSLAVSKDYIQHWKIPFAEQEEIVAAAEITTLAVKLIYNNYKAAKEVCLLKSIKIPLTN